MFHVCFCKSFFFTGPARLIKRIWCLCQVGKPYRSCPNKEQGLACNDLVLRGFWRRNAQRKKGEMFFPMKKAAKVKENIHAKVRFYRCSCLQIIVFYLRVAGQSPSLLWQILFSRTWRQLSLDGRPSEISNQRTPTPLAPIPSLPAKAPTYPDWSTILPLFS